MKNFFRNLFGKFKQIIGRFKEYKATALLSLYAFLLIIVVFQTYQHLLRFYVEVKFDEVAPVSYPVEVFYKGFKVGHTAGIKPSADYKFALVKLVFVTNVSLLPENISAIVKKHADDENGGKGKVYMELMYPDSPSISYLKKGSVISGKMEADMNSFISSQVASGVLNDITNKTNDALASVKNATDILGDLFSLGIDMLNENRGNLKKTTAGIAQAANNTASATKELTEMSAKLNNSIDNQGARNTTGNIEETTRNLKEMTENLNKATKDLDKTTKSISETVNELSQTATNAKNISGGFESMMKKRFFGTRVLFGKPMD